MPTSSTKQTVAGKAFEYAFANTLYNYINNNQKVSLIQNSSLDVARSAFAKYNADKQENYNKAALAAIRYITKLEPRLLHPISDERLDIIIQPDSAGKAGDIRDIVTVRSAYKWEIGFSAKNNHEAVKHSRLSDKINFGREWFGIPCSTQYMTEISSIFAEIRKNKEQGQDLLWSQIPEKDRIYTAVVDTFVKEVERLNKSTTIATRMLQYLIGKKDFYKVMKFDNYTTVQAFNINGTLNKSSGEIQPQIRVPKLKLPTNIEAFTRKGDNTVTICFNNGWQVSFRIHNASLKAEPSLKFDIQLIGIPQSLYTHDELWSTISSLS